MEKAKMVQCYNRGCGKTYDPEQNTDESCQHHPGVPFFHDAYKGWSCCNKKSVDFTEFLNIKGCTLSKHSNEKPPEPVKPKQNNQSEEEKENGEDEKEIVEIRAPIREALPRPPLDTPMTTVQSSVAPALKQAIDKMGGETITVQDCGVRCGEIPIGTTCKNSGCTHSYTGTSSDNCECQYHPGVPIFHEGLKFWSCCQKRTTDFAVFLAQKGCAYGEHVWIKENEDKKVVKCRYDWHQTATNVIVSIYAKMYHYAKSVIEVNPVRLHIHLVFPEQDNARFDIDLELRGIIDPAGVKAHMNSTKLEITMPKAEPGSWPKLDFPNTKLPPPQSVGNLQSTNEQKKRASSDSDGDFNLDDIDTVSTGFRLAEISSSNDGVD